MYPVIDDPLMYDNINVSPCWSWAASWGTTSSASASSLRPTKVADTDAQGQRSPCRSDSKHAGKNKKWDDNRTMKSRTNTSLLPLVTNWMKIDRVSNLPLEQQQHGVHDPHDEMRRFLQLPHCGDVCRFNGLKRNNAGNTIVNICSSCFVHQCIYSVIRALC